MRLGFVLRWARSPPVIILIAFSIPYLAAIHYCNYNFSRDPTSAFFDPSLGYERKYSLLRQQEAETYIQSRNDSVSEDHGTITHPQICVGIATIARDEEQYVRSTIGSLLDGLSPIERGEIYLIVLIAHTAPETHPIYGEEWLTNVVDTVLTYDVSQKQMADLQTWETEKQYRKKAIFDYTYVLQRCHESGFHWVAMVEDDTLAVRGWYPKAIEALETADALHPMSEEREWLYLRMFYTEEFLGWNSEEWMRYLMGSIGFVGMIMMVLMLVKQVFLEKAITNSVIVVICLICIPACILLYFAAGRLSMQPLSPGVYQMPKFGCCAQGLVFSRSTVPKVIARLAQVREGYVDEIIEAWANEINLVRWVTIPSLLQHIGGHSSKGDDFGDKSKYDMSVAEKIWNFGFEMYDQGIT